MSEFHFGDDDPEDAWDVGDPLPEKLDLLARWALSVLIENAYDGRTPRVRARAGDASDTATFLGRERNLTPAQSALLALVVAALEHVR